MHPTHAPAAPTSKTPTASGLGHDEMDLELFMDMDQT